MKRPAIFIIALLTAACARSSQPIANSNTAAANTTPTYRSESVIAHSADNRSVSRPDDLQPAEGKPKWTQSGDPIDTRELDAAVSSAEKSVKSRPGDGAAKEALAAAYLKRAIALTDARQYASALGDYRRTLKYDPDNGEAQDWVKQIVMIYASLGREAPKEGEEPPPLPFKAS